jgi:conjugal transfer pilus assembly protein TraV
MIRSRRYLIACLTLTLTGCAGMKDDFDCKAVASDSCMTMRQADEIAKQKDQNQKADYSQNSNESSGKGGGAGRAHLPSLIDMSNSLTPARIAYEPLIPSRVLGYAATAPLAQVPDSGVKVFPASTPGSAVTPAAPYPTSAGAEYRAPFTQACTSSYCPKSMQPPLRAIETVVSLWIAPYVDGIDAVHAPGEVYFVRSPTAWRDRYEP